MAIFHVTQASNVLAGPRCAPINWSGVGAGRGRSRSLSSSSRSEHGTASSSGPHLSDGHSDASRHVPLTSRIRTGPPATASISRFFLVGQPQTFFRSLSQRQWPTISGPMSLLLFLASLIVAVLAAIRAALVKRVKNCRSCKGYGITRCQLCDGQGKVDWRAKFVYTEVCPLCMSKRYIICPDCGGFHHRRLFSHGQRPEPA